MSSQNKIDSLRNDAPYHFTPIIMCSHSPRFDKNEDAATWKRVTIIPFCAKEKLQ